MTSEAISTDCFTRLDFSGRFTYQAPQSFKLCIDIKIKSRVKKYRSESIRASVRSETLAHGRRAGQGAAAPHPTDR